MKEKTKNNAKFMLRLSNELKENLFELSQKEKQSVSELLRKLAIKEIKKNARKERMLNKNKRMQSKKIKSKR